MSTWSNIRHFRAGQAVDHKRGVEAQREQDERRQNLRAAFSAHRDAMRARYGEPVIEHPDYQRGNVTWTCAGHVIGRAKLAGVPVDHEIIDPED